MTPNKCVVLLSGGLDSTTTLYYAKAHGFHCHALIFDYSQRHSKEVKIAAGIARMAGVPYKILKVELPWKGSSLLDQNIRIPEYQNIRKTIPSTYVPGRNTIFISFAISYAEAIGAKAVFIGANAVDFSGYPDCRPGYYKAFNKLLKVATKQKGIRILTPLINMKKSDIIRLGTRLGAPLEDTWSCYKGGSVPCGTCDSCRIREKGFREILEPATEVAVPINREPRIHSRDL